jgi:5-methylcytosine-specific restriction endonuclease McrA
MRPKKCKVCKQPFERVRPLQQVCSPICAYRKVRAQRERVYASEIRVAKAKAKTRGQWQKEAQVAFNSWIRERDINLPCVSCGRFHEGQWHAGHFRATSVAPALRFEPDNVHRQCSACNTHLHGNLLEYRIRLINRIGVARVEWLEGPHEPAKYTIPELQEIKAKYTRLARELKRGNT